MVKEISPQGIPALLAFLLEQAAQGMCGCWMCTGMVIALLERLLHFCSYKVGQKRWEVFLNYYYFFGTVPHFLQFVEVISSSETVSWPQQTSLAFVFYGSFKLKSNTSPSHAKHRRPKARMWIWGPSKERSEEPQSHLPGRSSGSWVDKQW